MLFFSAAMMSMTLSCVSGLGALARATRIDLAGDDLRRRAEVADVVDAIETSARTDSIGDGKVWVVALEQVLRIRTGEKGPDAI